MDFSALRPCHHATPFSGSMSLTELADRAAGLEAETELDGVAVLIAHGDLHRMRGTRGGDRRHAPCRRRFESGMTKAASGADGAGRAGSGTVAGERLRQSERRVRRTPVPKRLHASDGRSGAMVERAEAQACRAEIILIGKYSARSDIDRAEPHTGFDQVRCRNARRFPPKRIGRFAATG